MNLMNLVRLVNHVNPVMSMIFVHHVILARQNHVEMVE